MQKNIFKTPNLI